MLKQTPEWELGQWGERQVRRWLEHDCGMFVLPASLIEDGGAPALTCDIQRHVLPDYLGFGGMFGGARWAEVKTKTRSAYYQIAGEHRHGISARLWAEYQKIKDLTGIAGILTIIQLTQFSRQQNVWVAAPLLLWAPFDELLALDHNGSTEAHGEQMVWFRLDDFERINITIHGPQAPRITPKTIRPWETKPISETPQKRLRVD